MVQTIGFFTIIIIIICVYIWCFFAKKKIQNNAKHRSNIDSEWK